MLSCKLFTKKRNILSQLVPKCKVHKHIWVFKTVSFLQHFTSCADTFVLTHFLVSLFGRVEISQSSLNQNQSNDFA